MAEQADDIVTSEFREAWESYHAWEPAYCAEKLATLRTPDTRASTPAHISLADLVGDPRRPSATHGDQDGPADTYVQYFVNGKADQGSSIEGVIHRADRLSEAVLPAAYATYESCTPISWNILHGDDSDFAPFVPLADDPNFAAEHYAADHKGLAWQEGYHDSDMLAIVLEAARRLGAQHKMSITQIDHTGILPLTLGTSSVCGAVETASMNDPIPWPAASRTLLADFSAPAADDLQTRLQDYMTLWCPRRDCLMAYCFSHASEQVVLDPNSSRGISKDVFKLIPSTDACGPDCDFLYPNGVESDIVWTVEDHAELQMICHLAPPTTACALARLSQKPCYEVAAILRANYTIANSITGTPDESDIVPTPKPVGCDCYASYKHSKKSKISRCCVPGVCPCRDARRECDPTICSLHSRACLNSQIQKGLSLRTDVKRSRHGMGLYLVEDALKGDLVIEYFGELIYEATFITRCVITSHTKRSYVCELNDQDSIDSAYAGNPARFINHAPAKNANVEISILEVNGEQRIGIFARKKISASSELFMDYGPEFPIPGSSGHGK